jgi:class 3 adenylate cyclase
MQYDDESHYSSIVEPEQLRSSTLHSIRYLASHVPTIVLTRLREEVMEWNTDFDFHRSTSFEEDLQEEEVPLNDESQGNASELSDISDLSHEDESENDYRPVIRRVAIHEKLETKGEEVTNHHVGLHEAQFLARDDEDPAPSAIGQELLHDPDIPRPSSRRYVRVSSIASVVSYKYSSDCPLLPFATKYEASLLFVDISGFTLLSTLLALEDLSKAINEYFELIVNEVTGHGGDILKFAGDGLFAMWKVNSHRSTTEKSGASNDRMNIYECITAAAVCGSKIVSKYSGHPIAVDGKVTNGREKYGLVLNVHCGISLGEIISVHVGDNDSRRENVILGKPITDVSEAAAHAKIGEVAACPASIQALARICKVHDSIVMSESMAPVVIAYKNSVLFTPMKTYIPRSLLLTESDPLSSKVGRLVRGLDLAALLRYRKLLSLYVHPVVAANDAGNVAVIRAATLVGERVIEEAELRNVFVMFIAPMISVTPSGDGEKDSDLFDLLNSIMNLTTKELTRFGGQLRQYIVDDKGLVLIATLGLRGSTFPHMVAERALPMAMSIQNSLLSDLEVQSRIGATVGNAYCGVVGGLMRHEYAILGPSVNLAARLMGSLKKPGMSVDNAIRLMADKSFAFGSPFTVYAKGYAEPVAIFEPLSPLQRHWGRRKPNFVGRRQELQTLAKIAYDTAMSSGHTPGRLVLISGASGMGKSTLVVHLIERIRRSLKAKNKRISVVKYVSRDSDRLAPFGAFGSILLDAMVASERLAGDDNSAVSSSNSIRSWGSFSAISGTLKARIADRVMALCHDSGGTPEFAQMVCQHLLNINTESQLKGERQDGAATKLSLVKFLCKAFLKCTQEADLVLVALDDVHLTDAMSFKVIQELFESGSKVMIICASRPLSDYRLAIDNAFWMRLNTEYTSSGRFVPVELKHLSETDMKTMIGKTLGISEEAISERLQRTIHAQSGGMPQFAHVLLEHLKKASLPSTVTNFSSKLSNLDAIAAVSEAHNPRFNGTNTSN